MRPLTQVIKKIYIYIILLLLLNYYFFLFLVHLFGMQEGDQCLLLKVLLKWTQ